MYQRVGAEGEGRKRGVSDEFDGRVAPFLPFPFVICSSTVAAVAATAEYLSQRQQPKEGRLRMNDNRQMAK